MDDQQVTELIDILEREKKHAEDQAKRGDSIDIYYDGRATALSLAIDLVKMFAES